MHKDQRIALCRISAFTVALMTLSLSTLAAANDEQLEWSERVLQWGKSPAEQLAGLRIKAVDQSVLQHAHEKRGFVTAPLDYTAPSSRKIDIFYRLLPSRESSATDSGHPILVIMNGGPGTPSSAYRALDYDYEVINPADAFSELAKYFRILMVDQRGTGNSSPIDLDSPGLSPEVIARYFDSDEHARDHARVIARVIPTGEPFYILARSYGGEIGFQYLRLGANVRQPAGVVFSSAILPHTDALQTFLMRRKKQSELNIELVTAYPGVVNDLAKIRSTLVSFSIDPGMVNFLWADLGQGANWQKNLVDKIGRLSEIDDSSTLVAELGGNIRGSVNLLNYVLSSAALTPGYTDRSVTVETSRQVPFESWMLDENWTLNQIGNDGTWREDFVASVDRSPPPPTQFPSVEEIRGLFQNTQVLFTFGQSDGFLPKDLQLNRARRFSVPGHTVYRVFAGGHGAAFSREGAAEIAQWAAETRRSSAANDR